MVQELTPAQKEFMELLKTLPPLPQIPAPAGKEDWEFRDISWIREDLWDDLINNILGRENVSIMAASARNFKDTPGNFVRGQIFISPIGMERLRERNRQNKRQQAQEDDSLKE